MEKYRNWHVELTNGDKLFLSVDGFSILSDGSVVFHSKLDGEELPVIAFASGQWRLFFAVQPGGDSAIAVERWEKPVSPSGKSDKAEKRNALTAEERIVAFLSDKGERTIREMAQGLRGLNTREITAIVGRLANENVLSRLPNSKTERFSVTEVRND